MPEVLCEENRFQSDNLTTNESMHQVPGLTFSQFMSQMSPVIYSPKCMKMVVLVVFVGFVFLSGFMVGNWSARISQNSPAARTYDNYTQEKEEEEDEEKEWQRSKNYLVNLGCEPRPTTLPIPYNTSHGYQQFKPTHLVVERCLSNYNFCGTPRYGEAEGKGFLAGERCLPTKKEFKDFPVMYFDSGQEVEVSVSIEVHEECTCENGNG
ncbi:hypothetical protein Pmani_037064 [Petrolisthes manimaculis]|uniref:Uncharacterized protein n=1 Tax=Petrolisthes manimaculis TaxID=1843537 RepID=A0AAE1NI29_9EUCA|nr:hypothetical protein Pmani_037064 [Petrolisthes manimaculis]